MENTKTTPVGARTHDIRPATHGFNVYIHPALIQIHINDGDEVFGETLANVIAKACENVAYEPLGTEKG